MRIMDHMRIFLFLFWNFCNAKPVINNIGFPSCCNCIHYRPSIYSSNDPISTCANFGEKDIITGEITYKYADVCRKDESACGHIGKYYEMDHNADVKLFFYSIVQNAPMTILVALIILCGIFAEK